MIFFNKDEIYETEEVIKQMTIVMKLSAHRVIVNLVTFICKKVA